MTPETIEPQNDDNQFRPIWLKEVVGQKAVVQRLGIALNAAKKLHEPVPHILFEGPAGQGKTTLVMALATELGTSIQMTSGPALSKPMDLMPFFTNADERSILLINELHRLPRDVQEFIYPAMEDFRVNVVLGEGINARTITMTLRRFTLIGSTTRPELVPAKLRSQFTIREHLDPYGVEELAELVTISARGLKTSLTADAALELAKRCRGTPCNARARLEWARTFAASEADGAITLPIVQAALKLAEVDNEGLEKQDRTYLETLIGMFDGGPAESRVLASLINLPVGTLKGEIEPFLFQKGFIRRDGSGGRMATPRAYNHLGK
jgi:Holliday junction DNA helicase RuvB